ncbi:MAG: DUF2975 domain-containing protein [Lachnospiraceae bacterium]|nr:DUF2975 domain-containing protein [Lachnospiraceae bacterium]
MKNDQMEKKKNITQESIAGRLKIITAAIAVIGGVFFIACAVCLVRSTHFEEVCGIPRESAMILLAATAALCYAALWQFGKVCREIGRENSFSVENNIAFRMIRIIFLVLSMVWLVFIAVCLILFEKIAMFTIFVLSGMTFIWLCIAALSGTLALLIDKARQIREENDYTI